MSTIWTFGSKENQHGLYNVEDCVKKFCQSLREQMVKIIHFKKVKMMPLTNEQQELYKERKICYICNLQS